MKRWCLALGFLGCNAEPSNPPTCRLSEAVTTEGVYVTRVRHAASPDGETITTDLGDDGVIDSTRWIETVDAETVRVHIDADGDGRFELVTETRTVWRDDGLEATRFVQSMGSRTGRQKTISTYASADRASAAGRFPTRFALDFGSDGAVDSVTTRRFEAGRVVRVEDDTLAARFTLAAPVVPDGVADRIIEYTYDGAIVRGVADEADYRCGAVDCVTTPPDGQADVITELAFDTNGTPALLEEGRPIRARTDFEADGTWDLVREWTYAEHGGVTHARVDWDADGVWDQVTESTWACDP